MHFVRSVWDASVKVIAVDMGPRRLGSASRDEVERGTLVCSLLIPMFSGCGCPGPVRGTSVLSLSDTNWELGNEHMQNKGRESQEWLWDFDGHRTLAPFVSEACLRVSEGIARTQASR